MKFLLLALVAVASATPDSDSDSLYGLGYGNVYGLRSTLGYNYGLPATTTYGLPATTTYGLPATTYGVPATTYTSGVYNNVFGYNRFVKRDADADAEPYYPYFYGQQQYPLYTYAAQRTVAAGEPVYKSGTFHTNYRNVVEGAQPAAYGSVGQVYQPVSNIVQRYIAKRDAESDSDAYYPLASALYPNVRSAYYPTSYGVNTGLNTYRPALSYGYNYNLNTAYPQYLF